MRYLFAPLLLALHSTAAPAPVVLEGRAANPSVTIASGVVVGTATGVANLPKVTGLANAYLGIPFAQSPPVRFAPPTEPQAWKTPLEAHTQPAACLQQFASGTMGDLEKKYFNNPDLAPPRESEDCLYLNVFAPQDANATNLKPVMFWLFGGNLVFGTAALAYYNGSSLAVNHDVVVVVPNYRTNFFGFSNSPEIAAGEQNSGLLDQRFALQWVQDNIKQFGGDPSQVTLFGESAGGMSVKQLLALPPSPLPFVGAIMESEAVLTYGNGETNYNNVVSHFNCSSAASQIACLRKVSGTDIQTYITAQDLTWPPVQDNETYVGYHSLSSIQSGQFADVPILIGTNKDEGRVFASLLGVNGSTSSASAASVADAVRGATGIDISSIVVPLSTLYGLDVSNDTYLLVSQIITDIQFTCPARSLSTAIALEGRQPIWRYRFDAAFHNVAFFPDPGAYHTSEIPEVWGTYPVVNTVGSATPDQIALSTYMQTVWTNFAKQPAKGVPWPRLTGSNNNSVELGLLGAAAAPAGEHTVPLLTADAPCLLYDPILLLIGQQY